MAREGMEARRRSDGGRTTVGRGAGGAARLGPCVARARRRRVVVRKKAQVCPKCKKPAATLLEWPQLNWWPSILCWPCVQEHIENDNEQLEEVREAGRLTSESL